MIEHSVIQVASGSRRVAKPKYGVADLPLPIGSNYMNRWRKQYRQTLMSWAGTHLDPFGTNSLLMEDVIRDIWSLVFSNIDIDMRGGRKKNLEVITALVSRLLNMFPCIVFASSHTHVSLVTS